MTTKPLSLPGSAGWHPFSTSGTQPTRRAGLPVLPAALLRLGWHALGLGQTCLTSRVTLDGRSASSLRARRPAPAAGWAEGYRSYCVRH